MAAEAPRAMLYATGNVSVNGSSITRSATVLDGDVIQTKSDSAVTLANNGSSVLVPGNSSVVYSSDSVSIASGAASIKTSRGMSAHIGSMTISPAGNSAHFRVVQNGKNVEVAALEGTLSITNGAKSVSLDAGKSMTMAMNQDPATPAPPAPSQGGAGAGGGGGGGLGAHVGLIIGLSAVAVAGIAAAVAVNAKNASPTTP